MGTTNKQITLLTVYERVQYKEDLTPGFSVSGGAVNLYNSIKANPASDAPADKTEMELDQASPLSVGYHKVGGDSDHILWETATGSPVVKTKNLIK